MATGILVIQLAFETVQKVQGAGHLLGGLRRACHANDCLRVGNDHLVELSALVYCRVIP